MAAPLRCVTKRPCSTRIPRAPCRWTWVHCAFAWAPSSRWPPKPRPRRWCCPPRLARAGVSRGCPRGRGGDLGLGPLSLQGRLQARSLPLHALEPYFADMLNVELVRADGNFLGQLRFVSQPAGPELAVQGDVELVDLRMRSALASPVQAAGE